MENRQRSIRKLLWRITAVLAVLAVVSICFVSGTFARYVSNRSGSTVTDVAKWDIDFTDGENTDGENAVENNFTVTVGKLSPDMSEYGTYDDDDNQESAGATHNQRVKTTDAVLALQITNSGDVDAELVVTPPENNALTFYVYDPEGKRRAATDDDWGSGFAIGEDGTVTAPTQEQARAVITMQFALVPKNTNVADITWYSLGQEGANLGTSHILKALPAEGGLGADETNVYCFYARAVWTSQDQNGKDYADTLDTWLGENIAALGGEFTFAAIQASEWPTTTP